MEKRIIRAYGSTEERIWFYPQYKYLFFDWKHYKNKFGHMICFDNLRHCKIFLGLDCYIEEECNNIIEIFTYCT